MSDFDIIDATMLMSARIFAFILGRGRWSPVDGSVTTASHAVACGVVVEKSQIRGVSEGTP
jgi:hypothetical protein